MNDSDERIQFAREGKLDTNKPNLSARRNSRSENSKKKFFVFVVR